MHSRLLGTTGISPSILGIGSSPFRDGSPDVCGELLEQAFDLGITYYDTARSYLNGEEAVAHLPQRVRSELVIASKTGARGGTRCVEDLQRSLNTMKRDWIDVWMTHMIETEAEYELCTSLGGFCDISAAARDAGLIRASGASFHAPTGVILRAIEERAFDVVMFQYNLIGRETVFGSSIESHWRDLLPAAEANGVGVVVMKVLAGGELRHGAPGLNSFAATRDCESVIGAAIRYSAMESRIATSVVGMRNTHEVVSAVQAVRGIDDSMASESASWRKAIEGAYVGECTRCGECLDICPVSIEIPKVFRLFDQKRFFGMDGVARWKYGRMEVDASACARCSECQKACPEDFDIGALLDEAHVALKRES